MAVAVIVVPMFIMTMVVVSMVRVVIHVICIRHLWFQNKFL